MKAAASITVQAPTQKGISKQARRVAQRSAFIRISPAKSNTINNLNCSNESGIKTAEAIKKELSGLR
jgi:hypothetical protein